MLAHTRHAHCLSALAALGPLASAASAQCERPWMEPRVIDRAEPLAAVNADGRVWREIATSDSQLAVWTFDEGPHPVCTVLHDAPAASGLAIDIDGNGIEELAAVTLDPSTLRVFRYDEAWSEVFSLPAPGEGALVSIDHGADGDPDILLVTSDQTRLYLNQGSDEFIDAGSIAPGGGVRHWVGHVDDNGLPDLVRRYGEDNGSVYAYLQQPDGSFVRGPLFRFRAVDAGDLTGDGLLDLVGEANPVQFAPSLGDGSFGAPAPLIEEDVEARALTDLDADGDPDVLAYDAATDRVVSFVLEGGEYTRLAGGIPPLSEPILLTDVSGDGIDDYVGLEGVKTAIIRADGNGGYHAPMQTEAFDLIRRLSAADLDRDGDPDVVAIGDGAVDAFKPGLVVLRNTGTDLEPWVAQNLNDSVFEAPVVHDLDGDGDLDIAIWSDNEIILIENTPDGMFSVRRSLPAADDYFAHRLFPSDLDRNGLPDLVLLDELAAFRIWFNQGGWSFAPASVESTHPYPLAVADLTGDGLDDVALRSPNDAPTPEILVLPGRGDGTFGAPIVSQIAENYAWAYSGDFDGDGAHDMLAVRVSAIALLRNVGDGSFQDLGEVAVYSSPRGIGVADFDRDGLDDFVAGSQSGHAVGIRLSNGDGSFSAEIPVFAPAGVVTAEPADMDGDGELDIVLASNPASRPSVITAIFSRCVAGCPVDLNQDGLADTRDVIAFLQLWAASDDNADWNGDGHVNTLDLAAFLADWAAGCA